MELTAKRARRWGVAPGLDLRHRTIHHFEVKEGEQIRRKMSASQRRYALLFQSGSSQQKVIMPWSIDLEVDNTPNLSI